MRVVKMDRTHALQYLGWEYEPPYAFYNIPPHALESCLTEIMDDNGMNYYAVLDERGSLFGMYEYSFPEGVMEIGLGIRPEDTGKGLGRAFVRECVSFGRKTYAYNGIVSLCVAGFNSRAIRLYRSLGFRETGLRDAEAFGKPVRFLCMALPPLF